VITWAYAIDVDLSAPAIQRVGRLAEKVRSRGHFRIRHADLQNWREEIDRNHDLINRALAHLPGFVPWQREARQASLEPFRSIAGPDLILVAETTEGETVGCFPGIPNLNEALIHVNEQRYPWNYLQLF